MTDDLGTKITEQIMLGQWTDLRPHWAERDAVLLINQDLSLPEVAEKIARDDTASVSVWLQKEQISRPTRQQAEAWDQIENKSFRFVIIQPYVLIQEQGH